MLAACVMVYLALFGVSHVCGCVSPPKLRSKSLPGFKFLDPTSERHEQRVGKIIWPWPTEEYGVCSTTGCTNAAREVLSNMNKDVDPCDDFYEFACGNFLKRTKIPDDASLVGIFSTIQNKVSEQLRTIMEEPSATEETRPYKLAKELYATCMDTDTIENIGLSYIKDILRRIGGWPVLEGDGWDASKFTWEDTVYKLKEEGLNFESLISFRVVPNNTNIKTRVIQLSPPPSMLPRSLLIEGMENQVVQALYSYLVDIAVIFGADTDQAAKEIKGWLDFEIQLANITLPPEENLDASKQDNLFTIPQLQQSFPTIPWAEYISTILNDSAKLKPGEVVIVTDPTYVDRLSILLENTPKRIQANFMLGRASISVVPYLTKEIINRNQEYYAAVEDQTRQPPRWHFCVATSAGSVPLAVSSLYVQRYFREERRPQIRKLVKLLRDQMKQTLEAVEWMDEETRKQSIEKVNAMTFNIGYPDNILDVNELEKRYRQLNITKGNLMKAVLQVRKFKTESSFRNLRKPVDVDEDEPELPPTTVNAFYNFQTNRIELTAAILQGGFFSHERPNYINFGAIGYVVGHEITHGFDNTGRKYDKDGNLVDWWTPETSQIYLDKVSCLINQYGNFTVEQVGQRLNGVFTLGENIADNGGIKLAYRAYNHWVAEHGTEKRLPGLENFTPKQMFWISAANTYCEKYRSKQLKQKILRDPHSPGEFRVRGPLSNQAEFAEDFKCPDGSNMNPSDKCQLW